MNKTASSNPDTPADLELTESDLDEIRRVAEMPDSAIDYSDIPPTNEADWRDAIPGALHRPIKTQVTLRIDADILVWARRQGTHGYQSRLNAILREAMLRDLRSKRQTA